MYLLDTNVLSETMRAQPDQQVLAWLDAQTAHTLFVSAITQAEIHLGVALLPTGQRRQALAEQVQALFTVDFQNRCLPFDASCASPYARVVEQRRAQGKPITTEDAQIASIALVNQMTLVTRNVRDFEGIEGLALLNHWAVH